MCRRETGVMFDRLIRRITRLVVVTHCVPDSRQIGQRHRIFRTPGDQLFKRLFCGSQITGLMQGIGATDGGLNVVSIPLKGRRNQITASA